jgi:CRISPR/Cas system-associated exonuclease Cas4 (RecB family)
MTNPRVKKDKLAQTTITNLKDIFIGEVYDRHWEFSSKYTEKGNFAEEDSLTLLTENRNTLYVKNSETLENDFIKGTPDIIHGDLVIDVKTAWNMRTFMAKDSVEKMYYWQLQGYMWLTGKKKAELVYTLVNSPEHLIADEKSRQQYLGGYDEGSKEQADMDDRVDRWMKFDDIDPKLRMRVYEVEYNEEDIEALKLRIADCRDYLNTITLN